MTPVPGLEPGLSVTEKMDAPPDWDNIRFNLKFAPDEIGGLKKEVIAAALDLLQTQWEAIQQLPRTLDHKAIHIRPDDLKGLPKAVQIFGDQIFIVNKGKGTKKIGDGYFKEPTRGVNLNAMRSFVHATIRLDGQEFVKAEVLALTERAIEKLCDDEILLRNEIALLFEEEIENLADNELFLRKDVAGLIQREIGNIGNDESLLKQEIRTLIGKMLNSFLSKEDIRTYIEQEIELLELFKGEESIIQLYQSCRYPSKKKIGRPSVEKIAISMEDCEMGDLFQAVNKDAFNDILNQNKNAALSFVRVLIQILAALEKTGVLHRDIKPENIFVTFEAILKGKLGDFGLGNIREQEIERLQKNGQGVGGSPEYSSPAVLKASDMIGKSNEAFRKDNMDAIMTLCGHANDVWSMGIVLYDFLFGDLPPFAGYANVTQDQVDAVLKAAFHIMQPLSPIAVCMDNPKVEPEEEVFCIQSLNNDPAVMNILFKLISGMLQVEPSKCLSGNELLQLL